MLAVLSFFRGPPSGTKSSGDCRPPALGGDPSAAPRRQAGHAFGARAGAAIGSFGAGICRPQNAGRTGGRRAREASYDEPDRCGPETVGAGPDSEGWEGRPANSHQRDGEGRAAPAGSAAAANPRFGGHFDRTERGRPRRFGSSGDHHRKYFATRIVGLPLDAPAALSSSVPSVRSQLAHRLAGAATRTGAPAPHILSLTIFLPWPSRFVRLRR